jgi:hypothetical protein
MDGQMCGDPTCESPSCSVAALDAWQAEQDRVAREIVTDEFKRESRRLMELNHGALQRLADC